MIFQSVSFSAEKKEFILSYYLSKLNILFPRYDVITKRYKNVFRKKIIFERLKKEEAQILNTLFFTTFPIVYKGRKNLIKRVIIDERALLIYIPDDICRRGFCIRLATLRDREYVVHFGDVNGLKKFESITYDYDIFNGYYNLYVEFKVLGRHKVVDNKMVILVDVKRLELRLRKEKFYSAFLSYDYHILVPRALTFFPNKDMVFLREEEIPRFFIKD